MPADPDNENGFSNTSRYCNSLGSQHDISAAADADSMPVKLHQNVSIRLNACFEHFYIDVQHLPHRLVPLSLLAASPAPPDLSPPLAWVAPRHGRRPAVTTLHLPQRLEGQPAPADPQQERLKNRVIAAFQMQQLVEELAQREQAASDAAARCRDLEGRLSVMAADLEERRAVDRLREGLIDPAGRHRGPQGGPLRCRPDHQAPCIHPSAVHFDAEPHLQCWSGKVRLSLRDI
ncbi:hypothetical protein PAPYR_9887 [Paratrimastix pyriformis]|uniref:Uncharacterized protein n=1 Tax=Paratrimastix pyriformis TaxID=342808 RepID=A0ABQ8U7A6_9EUKA|nr:hypothetical protein PAPYR_9887 [Paratrimastix pyriformis]